MLHPQSAFIALASALVLVITAAPPVAANDTPDPVTVAGFAEALDLSSDPAAATSATAFQRLSASNKKKLVKIINDPSFAEEFLDFATSANLPAPGRTVLVDSELYPAQVKYQSSAQSLPLVGVRTGFGYSVGRVGCYRANSTATLKAASTAEVLGVTITRLNIWVTFKTGAQGIPKKAVSSGSSATNFNFFIVISSDNLKPYVSKGLAVAQTVWTGSVLVKDATFRFDKLDTLKAFSCGLYRHTLVNQ